MMRFMIVQTSKIGITETVQKKLGARLDDCTLSNSTFKVTANDLDGDSMGFLRLVSESADLRHSEGNINSGVGLQVQKHSSNRRIGPRFIKRFSIFINTKRLTATRDLVWFTIG